MPTKKVKARKRQTRFYKRVRRDVNRMKAKKFNKRYPIV